MHDVVKRLVDDVVENMMLNKLSKHIDYFRYTIRPGFKKFYKSNFGVIVKNKLWRLTLKSNGVEKR